LKQAGAVDNAMNGFLCFDSRKIDTLEESGGIAVTLKKTPLDSIHRRLGARMVSFAGWDLPVQYQSALEEHRAVRGQAGVFDVSHMGRLEVRGPGALDFIQTVACNDVSRLSDGQAQYSALLTPRGTFIDDIVVYRFAVDRFLLCVNASTLENDVAWLREHRRGAVEIVDRSAELAQLAVQGPSADSILRRITDVDLDSIRFYWFRRGLVAGVETIVSRTGYTGEPGFELYFDASNAETIWESLFEAGRDAGIRAAGLAARNTLRLEMRYPLYGNDIDDTTTPFEAGLGWIVKFGTGFIGEERLRRQKEEGVERKLAGFEMLDPGIARDGQKVRVGDAEVSRVTSGGFSPTMEKSIGLCYMPVDMSEPGVELRIDIRGRLRTGRIVETPFYRRN
jgi:aminomethyltransferase